MTGICKFLLNNLCFGVVRINAWAPSEVTLWFFSWCFKWLSIVVNINVCNLILIIFWMFWWFFFNGVSRFLVYSSSGSSRHIDSVWWVKCHINFFIICILKKWNWNRDCNNISSQVRALSILFAKFFTRPILLDIMEWVICLSNVEICEILMIL